MQPLFHKFIRGIYDDDVITGVSSPDEGYQFYLKAKVRLAEGGFNLRKFVTNSPDLWGIIASKEGPPEGSCQKLPDNHKVLGVEWNPATDKLCFEIRPVIQILNQMYPTKRNIVALAARIYDPLGMLTPVTVAFKVFFQLLCKAKLQ